MFVNFVGCRYVYEFVSCSLSASQDLNIWQTPACTQCRIQRRRHRAVDPFPTAMPKARHNSECQILYACRGPDSQQGFPSSFRLPQPADTGNFTGCFFSAWSLLSRHFIMSSKSYEPIRAGSLRDLWLKSQTSPSLIGCSSKKSLIVSLSALPASFINRGINCFIVLVSMFGSAIFTSPFINSSTLQPVSV